MTDLQRIKMDLEDIVYLAGRADSVAERRVLDMLLQATLTYVNAKAADAKIAKPENV